jgi:hypothetical protein
MKGGLYAWRSWMISADKTAPRTMKVTENGVTVTDKNGVILYELLPRGYAKALNCKVSSLRVSDKG